MNFKEKLTFYDRIKVSNSIIDNLNEIGQNIEININFINRLHNRKNNWYVDGDNLLLRFILGRGAFLNDINDKCILCKDSNNSQEHIVNECAKTKKLRAKLTKELNDLDNATKNKTLKDSQAKKSDNKGIRLIKKYVFKLYKLMKETLKETSSEKEQDA